MSNYHDSFKGAMKYSADDRHSSLKAIEQGYEELHKDDPKPVDSQSAEELAKRDINTLSAVELMSLGFAQLNEKNAEKTNDRRAKRQAIARKQQENIDATAPQAYDWQAESRFTNKQ